MQAKRPLATAEYLCQQVDDHRKPFSLVCADHGWNEFVAWRLLEAGRRERKARQALKRGAWHG